MRGGVSVVFVVVCVCVCVRVCVCKTTPYLTLFIHYGQLQGLRILLEET